MSPSLVLKIGRDVKPVVLRRRDSGASATLHTKLQLVGTPPMAKDGVGELDYPLGRNGPAAWQGEVPLMIRANHHGQCVALSSCLPIVSNLKVRHVERLQGCACRITQLHPERRGRRFGQTFREDGQTAEGALA
jgi:hypothetical protein